MVIKNAEFYADFKSDEIIGGKVFSKIFSQGVREEGTFQWSINF